jgi:hypothetical protein
MSSVVTSRWRRFHVTGSTNRVKQLLMLPVIGVALAPGMMGSLSHLKAPLGVSSLRQTVVVSAGSRTRGPQVFFMYRDSDGDGGPPVP